jgi:hypothetical protein
VRCVIAPDLISTTQSIIHLVWARTASHMSPSSSSGKLLRDDSSTYQPKGHFRIRVLLGSAVAVTLLAGGTFFSSSELLGFSPPHPTDWLRHFCCSLRPWSLWGPCTAHLHGYTSHWCKVKYWPSVACFRVAVSYDST